MSSDSNYEKLSDELQNKINTELFDNNGFEDNAIRRIDKEHDRATLWRPAFVRDVEKIMHSPYSVLSLIHIFTFSIFGYASADCPWILIFDLPLFKLTTNLSSQSRFIYSPLNFLAILSNSFASTTKLPALLTSAFIIYLTQILAL